MYDSAQIDTQRHFRFWIFDFGFWTAQVQLALAQVIRSTLYVVRSVTSRVGWICPNGSVIQNPKSKIQNHSTLRFASSHEEGMALVVAMTFISLALIVLGVVALRVVNQSRQVDHYADYENCMFGVESAFSDSLASLERGEDGMIGVNPDVVGKGAAEIPSFDSDGVAPVQLDTMPNVDYMTYVRNWGTDGLDNNGDGNIDETQEQWHFSFYASARDNGTVRRAERVMRATDVNVWRNAIFAGAGQAGGLVNGNTSIHGSVHLLGENLVTGTEAITALDLSGTSLIHNNYNGMPADLLSRVPPLPTRTFNGETISSLNAVLRVRHGLVGTSGNSEIGEPDLAGNAVKETMDATYVSDGWTGTSTIDDGGRGDPTHVFSDNGWDARYDLGDRVSMPMLSDDWRSPTTGAKVWDSARGANYTYEHYFDEVLVGDPVNKTDGIYSGDITIRANQNFYYNASRPSDTNPAHRLATDDYILFDAASNVMEINGQLSVNGSLTISRGSGSDKTIYYKGRAAILVHGNATLDTDLLSINADGSAANSFPVNSCFAIMASGDMTVGAISQLSLAGAFYAQGRMICSKQTNVLGTFVSNYFDMGTNVPAIFQVPSLGDNLPQGMIGAYPILAFQHVSWRELGV